MHHEIPHLERHQLFDGERFFAFSKSVLESESVISVKQLVIGIDQNLQFLIHKPLAELHGNWRVGDIRAFLPIVILSVGEDVVQTFQLSCLT